MSARGHWRVVALLVALLLAAPVVAQPTAELDVISTPHFRFTTARGAEEIARPLAQGAEALRERLCAELAVPCFTSPVRVHVARSVEEFVREQPGGPRQGAHVDWAAGVAYADLDYIVLRRDPKTFLDLGETFVHELSHVVLRKGVEERFLPRWFVEGVAILQAGESVLRRFESATAASLTGSLIPIGELTFRFPSNVAGRRLAYAESALFLRWLLSEHEPQGHVALLARVREGERFAEAFAAVFGASPDALWEDWRGELRRSISWLPLLTGSGLLWSLLTALFLWVYWKKRKATREQLARWAAEEDPSRERWFDA